MSTVQELSSNDSLAVSNILFPLFPATPTRPSALKYNRVSRDSVSLEWEPPEFDGGAKLTGYVIEKQDVRKNRWSYVHKVPATQHMFDVPALKTGQQYKFRVLPTNKVGLGDAMQMEEPVTIASPYSE